MCAKLLSIIVPAYNVAKTYHPQAASWVGYVIRLDGVTYYDAGDTDALKENESISCDVAFVPIGGTFTMDWKEASQFVNCLHPKMVVPIHYGSIVGSKEDEVARIERGNGHSNTDDKSL